MKLVEDDSGLRRALNRVPVAVRVGAFAVWAAVGAFMKWEGVNHHDVSAWLWVIALPGLALFAAFGLIRLSRSFPAPDRKPLELTQFWFIYAMATVGLLVFGPVTLVDDNPATKPYVGAPMFVVGLVLLGLFLRHRAKPIEAGHGDEMRSERPPPVASASWYPAATTTDPDPEDGSRRD